MRTCSTAGWRCFARQPTSNPTGPWPSAPAPWPSASRKACGWAIRRSVVPTLLHRPCPMPDRLSIQEPDAGQRAKPSWNAFLEQGFRPLYVAGCLWAAACVALWVFAPHWLAGTLQGVFWHAHEMLWGFVATIAVGFLFTAGANWSGTRP